MARLNPPRRRFGSLVVVGCSLALAGVGMAATDNSSCTVGTLEEDCVSTSIREEGEVFFCTDRYGWEWSQDVAQLPVQVSDSICLTMDSNVIADLEATELLVLGGCDAAFQEKGGDCLSLSNSTLAYNPASDVFEQKQSMPTERFRAAAVNVSEHVYLFGGRDIDGILVCTVDRYNVVTEKWETLDEIQDTDCFSDHYGVADDDGTIYLFGGYTQEYEAKSTVIKVEVSDTDQLTFSSSTPMGTRRGDHVCLKLPASPDVFCMGGFTEDNWDFSILDTVEHFDISTEKWQYKAPMIIPRADFGAGLLNNRITVIGGEDHDGPMSDVEWYDPVEDCWTDSGDLFDIPYERLRYCAATLETNKRIYIFGGQADNDPKSENYAIKDSVDWYQELLVETLLPSAGAASMRTSAGSILAISIGLASALLLTVRME